MRMALAAEDAFRRGVLCPSGGVRRLGAAIGAKEKIMCVYQEAGRFRPRHAFKPLHAGSREHSRWQTPASLT